MQHVAHKPVSPLLPDGDGLRGPGIPAAKPFERSAWKRRASRLWHVLRYYRTSQVVGRLVNMGRRRAACLVGARRYTRPPRVVPKRRENPSLGSWLQRKLAGRAASGSDLQARDILEGRYRFLNQERALPDPVDWRLEDWPDVANLWRFHLHYHEFLLDLAAEGLQGGERICFDRAWELVRQWIEGNRPDDARVLTDAWHPYCISRRLPVWILLWTASRPGGELQDRVLQSMFSQARFLERHLEWDIRGNHLLENAKALVLAAAFLECSEADRWLRRAAGILRKEIAEQILPHGEHFERSPMYHAQVFEALLDVRDAVQTVEPALAELCTKAAARMAEFLREILHPDGEIPLLGDSCFVEASPAGHLITRAVETGSNQVPGDRAASRASGQAPRARIVGDYWIYRHGQEFLVFDAGPVGPDHLPAHAHADLLSFEASVQGRRLFVDSGVFNYRDDAMRRYCRSSRAHNVLEVDGQDQCDMWSRFRMGYRGWPSQLAAGETHGFSWARACHNAYRRIGVPTVGRWIACRPGGPWVCVDWAKGSGRHRLTGWLHLHPDVDAHQVAPDEVRLACNGEVLRWRSLTPGTLSLATAWYCPEFGRRVPAPVVRWETSETLPAVCGWYLAWDEGGGTASLEQRDGENILFRWIEGNHQFELRPFEEPLAR